MKAEVSFCFKKRDLFQFRTKIPPKITSHFDILNENTNIIFRQ